MRVKLWRSAVIFAFGAGLLSCTEPTGPTATESGFAVRPDLGTATPSLVISQVFGGGGNSGSVYKNDFIEVFNPGHAAVDVTGWSVQYNSSAGTGTWQVTPLSGSIPAGGYYLIQEAAQGGGTTSLPTPDVVAATPIPMAAGAGKVALTSSTVALAGQCPTGFVDEVTFGSTSAGCGWTNTAGLDATHSASRNNNGCSLTGTTLADFTVGAVNPRNSATPLNVCPAIPKKPATVTIAPNPASAIVGTTQAFTAIARDSSNDVTTTTFTWLSRNTSVANVSATGVATAVATGTTIIKVTTANGFTDSATLTVVAAPPGDVVISQVYGGGGNSGATYNNDYIELFNRGSEATDVTGWTVQYSSAGGSSWQSTTLSGTIQPGKYYLVQEAAGGSTPAPLPAPDATGAIAMAAGSGKVILALPGVSVGGTACPTGGTIIDRVGYGTSTNCSSASDWNGNTATLDNTTAAFRKIDGCTKTGNITNDFIALTPYPHNSASPIKNCNGVARVQSSATIVINEIMASPANAESASWGEWFEVHNTGASPINLNGWKIISGGTNQPDHTINRDVVVPAGGYAVLGRGDDISRNGGVALDYSYFVGPTTIWLDDADFLELVDAADARVDSVAWTNVTIGVTRGLRDASQPHVDVNGANWGYSSTTFGDGDYGTPDADNEPLVNVAPFVSATKISVSGRVATDAPLPVGFEAQLFASESTIQGVAVPGATFTWAAQTPSIATIDSRGVIHAVSAGTAKFLITANDGTTHVHSLQMITPVASATAVYLDNAAFGEPFDADASNDFIIRRPQYTTSFNHLLGTPNWVAYDLNATDITAGQDRCNCFTFDPELEAAGFTKYTTADYTGAGAYLGVDGNGNALHGVDRGHMTRSFDRTSGTLDNARTFYFANVVPQYSDLNQGPWANFENYLGDLAQNQNKEVYIYVGPAGSQGTVKGEGKINFPQSTWKIAVILPRGKGLADVHDYRDIDNVIAVIMPNTFGIRNVDWATNYVVTPQQIETLTGYHFFSALDARTRRAVETGTKPPLGSVDGPYNAAEGSAVNMSAAGSVDPNGTIVSYAWNFGDGNTGTGASVSHTYANNGSYTVSMIVTDNDGLADTVTTTSHVTNVAPAVGALAGATLLPGETYSTTGSFTDPGPDTWSATVDYGDGSGTQALALTGKTFSLSHAYASAGTFTVTVAVSDGDDSGNNTAIVTVLTSSQGIGDLKALVNELISSGALSSGNGNSLIVSLDAALNQIANGNNATAVNQLNAFLNKVDQMVKTGKLTAAQGAALTALAQRIIAATS